jgi:hypothetical protein
MAEDDVGSADPLEPSGPPEEKRYTLEEANALLPDLIPALMRIREARQAVLAGGTLIRAAAPQNGGGEPGAAYWDALATLRREVTAMNERNIVLRDPETGLLDFPAMVEGRDAFLCWRLGEDRVAFWHGPETGFAGRRPLTPPPE